jgi:hypothetical protein
VIQGKLLSLATPKQISIKVTTFQNGQFSFIITEITIEFSEMVQLGVMISSFGKNKL